MRIPVRPYRSLQHYIERHAHLSGIGWPCRYCAGRGQIFCTLDQIYIQCSACGGTGQGTKKAWKEAYRKIIEKYQTEINQYKELVRLKKEARKKLTKEEIKAIQNRVDNLKLPF